MKLVWHDRKWWVAIVFIATWPGINSTLVRWEWQAAHLIGSIVFGAVVGVLMYHFLRYRFFFLSWFTTVQSIPTLVETARKLGEDNTNMMLEIQRLRKQVEKAGG